MKIEQKEENGYPVIYPEGEIDINFSPKLREALMSKVSKKPEKLYIDCTDVKYIDSSGIATLVEALREIRKYDGEMIVRNCSTEVRSVFEISKLDKVFSLE